MITTEPKKPRLTKGEADWNNYDGTEEREGVQLDDYDEAKALHRDPLTLHPPTKSRV